MLFKNLDTGLVWEVVNEDQIKRCKTSKKYEEVKEQPEEVVEKEVVPKKSPTRTTKKKV